MISIVISVAGNDFDRRTRLSFCLKSIRGQIHKNYEVIIVEQSLDNNFYYDDVKCDKYIQVKNPNSNKFNLCWTHNVGAVNSNGNVILFYDLDMIIPPNYLEKISPEIQFAFGAESYLWLNRIDSERYYRGQYEIPNTSENHYNVMIPGIRGGCGCILCFDRDFFFEEHGGFFEMLEGWGYDDTESANRLLGILGINEIKDLPKVNSVVAHLYHDYDRHTNTLHGPNRVLYEKLIKIPAEERVVMLKSTGIGKLDAPSNIAV